MTNKINHPSHYQKEGRKECIEEMLENYGNYITASFCLTNAYKYLYRAGEKEDNSVEQDMKKAKWYFNFVEKRLYSAVRYQKLVKLYLYVKEELKKYDKSRKN